MMARNLSNVKFVSGKLNHHVASGHEGRKPYKCDICNYGFAKKGDMLHQFMKERNRLNVTYVITAVLEKVLKP